MNEFITDIKKPAEIAGDFVSATANAAGTAIHQAGEEISSVLEKGREISGSAWKRMGNEAEAANAALHRNPYPAVLAGLGAGALLGVLVTRKAANRPA